MSRTELHRREPIELHSPELYRSERVADGVEGFDSIGDAEVALFHEQGYLVVHNAFTAAEIHDVIEGLLDLIDGANPDFAGPELEALAAEAFDSLPREEKQDHVRKLMYFVEYDPRLLALCHHPRLLAVVERLMDERPALWADQALLKPPRIGREKPWHQDCAYFNLPLKATVVGCWIALDETSAENGCMHVIPGSHRAGPVPHFQRRDWQICDTDVATEQNVMVPLKPGGALLFNGLLHHGTPANRSPRRRRAVQLHYRPASAAEISREERLAIYGSEGKDVDC